MDDPETVLGWPEGLARCTGCHPAILEGAAAVVRRLRLADRVRWGGMRAKASTVVAGDSCVAVRR